jgi:hypothetical protein
LFSFVGGLFGGGSQKKASQKAMQAMVDAMNRGIDTQNAFNQQTRQDYMPYTTAGTQAIGGMGDLTGLNGGDKQGGAIDALKASPLYQSLFRNGQEALLQNGAATGNIRGGNMQRGLADFGADTLSGVIQQQFGNLSNIAGLGVGAQGQVTGAGQNTANNVMNLQGQIGSAQAGNYLTKGGIDAKNWQNFGGFLDGIGSSLMGGGGLGGALKSIF